GGPCPRGRQTAHEILKLRALVPDGIRRRDLEAQARREALSRDDAAGFEHHFFLADIGFPGRPRIDRALRVGDLGGRRREERDLDIIGLPSARLDGGEDQLMAYRATAGGYLLAARSVEAIDRRMLRH